MCNQILASDHFPDNSVFFKSCVTGMLKVAARLYSKTPEKRSFRSLFTIIISNEAISASFKVFLLLSAILGAN